MAAYAYWTQNYFSNSVDELNRFIKLYPKNKNLDYAYYLLAMNYYDSIVDEKKIYDHLYVLKNILILLFKSIQKQIMHLMVNIN